MVGIRRRRGGRRACRGNRQRRQRVGHRQSRNPGIGSRGCCGDAAIQLGVVRLPVHGDVRDHDGAVKKVVEHQQRIHRHHHGVGQVAIVARRFRQFFKRAHHVVTPETHGAAGKARQPRHLQRLVVAKQFAEMVERRLVVRRDLPHLVRRMSHVPRSMSHVAQRFHPRAVSTDTLPSAPSRGTNSAPSARRPRAIRAGSRSRRRAPRRRRTPAYHRRARLPGPMARECQPSSAASATARHELLHRSAASA